MTELRATLIQPVARVEIQAVPITLEPAPASRSTSRSAPPATTPARWCAETGDAAAWGPRLALGLRRSDRLGDRRQERHASARRRRHSLTGHRGETRRGLPGESLAGAGHRAAGRAVISGAALRSRQPDQERQPPGAAFLLRENRSCRVLSRPLIARPFDARRTVALEPRRLCERTTVQPLSRFSNIAIRLASRVLPSSSSPACRGLCGRSCFDVAPISAMKRLAWQGRNSLPTCAARTR